MDRRVKYTKRVLRESLLALMENGPASRITVKALCARADVNRNTFYAHYGSPMDVLAEIEADLLREIQDSLEHLMQVEQVTAMLTEILRSLERNRVLCGVLLRETGDSTFLSRVLAIAHDHSVAAWRKAKPSLDGERMELLYTFFANGSAAIIRRWLLGASPQTPEALAAFLQQLIAEGFRSF